MGSAIMLLAAHLVCCGVLCLMNRDGRLSRRKAETVMAMMIPVFGPVCLLQHALIRRKGIRAAEFEIEKTDISDETRRSIPTDRSEVTDEVVPLTETVIVNRSGIQRNMVMETLFEMYKMPDEDEGQRTQTDESGKGGSGRREMMLDVLHDDPASYLAELMASDDNDDPEVVHYAVTALVEIQKRYDIRFQQLARALRESPDDARLLRENQLLLEHYLESGIPDENARRGQLQRYLEIVEKRLTLHKGLFSLMVRRAETLQQLEEAGKLKDAARDMIRVRGENEEGYLFLLRAFAMTKDREGIEAVIRELDEKNIYLSAAGRAEIGFWTGGGQKSET